uniref:Uncharacterized protein n=1 Tax=Phyllymenia taiwanensis TaxID=1260292 RepID=R9XYP4_9FLOR|nr:hypothetical protein [Grateloupia taiwanensis]AGO19791.1 hypothetical protein [Grateloupia taiwanensis]
MCIFYSENINKRFAILSIFNYFLLIFIIYLVLNQILFFYTPNYLS